MAEENEKFIKFFKALANEERIEMIKLLKKNEEMYAQDVERYFFLEQSTTSHHLNILKRAGIAKSRRAGRNIYYSINYDTFQQLWKEFGDLFFKR